MILVLSDSVIASLRKSVWKKTKALYSDVTSLLECSVQVDQLQSLSIDDDIAVSNSLHDDDDHIKKA